MCLSNKFRTMHSARMKNPLCRTGNPTLTLKMDAETYGEVDDEYCHAHSDFLRRGANVSDKRDRDRAFLKEFIGFVEREEPDVLPAIEAIFATGTQADAADFLGITDVRFDRLRARMRRLGECFEKGESVPSQRKPHKKRLKAGVALKSLAA